MLHAEVSSVTLGCVRIWVFGIWFVFVLLDPIPDLARFPSEALRLIGVLRLVPEPAWPVLLSAAGLWGLKLAMTGGLAALVLGLPGYRPLAVVTCGLLIFYQGLLRGFTFTNRDELALLYVGCALALFPAADAVALRRRPAVPASPALYSAALQLSTLLLLTSYSLVGIRRLVESAPGIFLDGTMLRYIAGRAAPGRGFFGDIGLAALEQPWLGYLLVVGYPIVTVFEALAPLCMVSRRFRWAWIPVMVGFHLVAWVFMDVLFLFNLLMIPVFLTDVNRLLAPRRGPGDRCLP